jgi:hypothetical protein
MKDIVLHFTTIPVLMKLNKDQNIYTKTEFQRNKAHGYNYNKTCTDQYKIKSVIHLNTIES